MRKIRTFAFAIVVALALAAFYLASAPVSAADKAVDINGKTSETGQMNILTGAVTTEQSGISSHFGRVSIRSEGSAGPAEPPADPGTFVGGGLVTIESANGDQLWGTYTFTGTPTEATQVITITGGTGRFANASGTLTFTAGEGELSQDGEILSFSRAGTLEGQIVKGPKPAKAAKSESRNGGAAVAPRSPLETTPPPAAKTEPPASTPVLPDASPSPGTTASTGTSATEPNPSAEPSEPRPESGEPGDSGTSASQSGG
jgi:hypothetical protein